MKPTKEKEVHPTKVKFRGQDAWFRGGLFGKLDTGPIAPLDHCDDNGEVLLHALFLDSLAHVYSGIVMCYGEEIGTLEDLLVGKL